MAAGGTLEALDASIASFFQSWNIWTTLLAGIAITILIFPLLTSKDPDIHPFLLARQAQASMVRQPGQSALYRANEIPVGYPLRKGLGVRDESTPKWSAGRDGDLRDVWRQALRGATTGEGGTVKEVKKGKILTVLGKEQVVEVEFEEVTKMINAIGKHVQEVNGKTVAVCLSNSVELLAVIFAAAFYNFKPVITPFGNSQTMINGLLSKVSPEIFIAEAGSFQLNALLATSPSIKHIIWVTKGGNTNMDWSEVPANVGGKVDISTWQDIVTDSKASKTDLPTSEKDSTHTSIVMFNRGGADRDFQIFEYTPQNIIAGTAALTSSLPRSQRLSATDTVLLTTPLNNSFTLSWALAALYSNTSLALTSVAGDTVNLTIATGASYPTVVVASSGTLAQYYFKITAAGPGMGGFTTNYLQRRAIAQGVLLNQKTPSTPANLSNLRLVCIGTRDNDTANSRLGSHHLSHIRFALGSRVVHALTSGAVAGAVTQSNVFDYRVKGAFGDKLCNVGAPLSSVEAHLEGEDEALGGERPTGKLVVEGPAVIGGRAELDVTASIDVDNTFILVPRTPKAVAGAGGEYGLGEDEE